MVDQENKYLLKDIYKKCALCHKYTRPKMKPIVSFNPENDFNQVIALDLHELRPGLWYLHMIDLFSRLKKAVVIRNKEAGVIADKLMQNWVAIYGAPEFFFFTDNGLEFKKILFKKWLKS